MGQGTLCPNSLRFQRDLLEPASDTQQKQHRQGARPKEFCPYGGKALRARIACAFSATDTSLLVTHNKKAADKERALRSFAPMGARHCVPE